jgi:hypothetical protein
MALILFWTALYKNLVLVMLLISILYRVSILSCPAISSLATSEYKPKQKVLKPNISRRKLYE